MLLTLDANIWIAAYDRQDRFHSASTEFLKTVTQQGHSLNGPSFVLIEVSCALARRTQKSTAGQSALELLRNHPFLTLVPLNEVVLDKAAQLGVQYLLRGADALYAATAQFTNAQLVSWDAELVQRANAITPSAWLMTNL